MDRGSEGNVVVNNMADQRLLGFVSDVRMRRVLGDEGQRTRSTLDEVALLCGLVPSPAKGKVPLFAARLSIEGTGGELLGEFGRTLKTAHRKLRRTLCRIATTIVGRLEQGKDARRTIAWGVLRSGELPTRLHRRLATALATPWKGRPTSACEFRPGDFVWFVPSFSSQQHGGIVFAQPPTPEMIKGRRRTRDFDVYVVGLARSVRQLRGPPVWKDSRRRDVDYDMVPEAFMVRAEPGTLTRVVKKVLRARYARWEELPVVTGPRRLFAGRPRVLIMPRGRMRKHPKPGQGRMAK